MFVDRRGRRRAGRHAPLGADGGSRTAREPFGRRDDSGEVAVADDDHAWQGSRCGVVERDERAGVAFGADDSAVHHPRPRDVRRVAMRAGDEAPAVDLACGRAADCPRRRRRHGGLGGNDACELPVLDEVAEADRAACRADPRVLAGQGRTVHAPERRRSIDQHLARGDRGAGQHRRHPRRRERPERALIERHQIGIGHDQRDRRHRHAQLVGDRLRERGPDVLADLGLARIPGDPSGRVHVNPGRHVIRDAALAAAAGLLLRARVGHRGDQQAAAEHTEDAHEIAALDLEPVARRPRQLVAFDFDLDFDLDPHRRTRSAAAPSLLFSLAAASLIA